MRQLFLSFLLCAFSIANAQQVHIIPQPQSISISSEHFNIGSNTTLIAKTDKEKAVAALFNEYLNAYYNIKLSVKSSGSDGIIFKSGNVNDEKEGYHITATPKTVTITGNTDAGTFYGMQTLIQLLPVQPSATLQIPCVTVADAPRFSYRGVHLDVGRHFFPVSFVKKYIDYLALHKINYFHWHLTEDQGWRIEIKKYPKLTTTGAWRNGTIIGNYPGKGNTHKKYGGYYTQAQVKEIVAYATERYITVVPEIEMPGHASAAIAAYPYLSCFPTQSTKIPSRTPWSGPTTGKQVQQTWGVFPDVFCAGKESVFTFLQDVLDEVVPLFPSKYVHIGGDESPKEYWKKCPNCQQRIKQLGLKDEHELQSYFVQRMEKYLNAKGKTIIGWDEILEGGLAPNAIVMSWRGEEGGITAAKQNHQVIMTPVNYAYFDYQQDKFSDSVTITANKSFLPIEKVYNWSIVPKSLNEAQQKYILGAQANMWTEYMNNTKKVEYMLFPRIAALSENLWLNPSKKDWNTFEEKLNTQLRRYSLWGINYYKK